MGFRCIRLMVGFVITMPRHHPHEPLPCKRQHMAGLVALWWSDRSNGIKRTVYSSVPACSKFQIFTSFTAELVGISLLTVSTFKSCKLFVRYWLMAFVSFVLLQWLCYSPWIVGFAKSLTKFSILLVSTIRCCMTSFSWTVHINGGEILVHPKADAGNQHQPQGNHDFLCVPALEHALFRLVGFCFFLFS